MEEAPLERESKRTLLEKYFLRENPLFLSFIRSWQGESEESLSFVSGADYLIMEELLVVSALTDEKDQEKLFAVLYLLFGALAEGSLCLCWDVFSLAGKIGAYRKGDPEKNLAEARALMSWFPNNMSKLDKILSTAAGKENIEFKPLIMISDQQNTYLYFQKYLMAWKNLNSQLREIALSVSVVPLMPEKTILQAIFPGPLHAGQKEAVRAALKNPLSIISGGPGTGKTTVTAWLLLFYLQAQKEPLAALSKVALAAPTGKAANRISESLKDSLSRATHPLLEETRQLLNQHLEKGHIKGQTIHRLLNFNPRRNRFMYHETNPLKIDLLIVDEVSMVDVDLMARLVGALKPGTRVVFLGDRHQLPSVEAGAALTSWVMHLGDDSTLVQELTHSFRSEKEIKELADSIIQSGGFRGHSLTKMSPGQDFSGARGVLVRESSGGLERLIEDIHKEFYELHGNYRMQTEDCLPDEEGARKARLEEIFKLKNRFQILCLTRKGYTGVENINARLAWRVAGKKAGGGVPRFAGAPIMILENDYQKGLFNGDTGILLRDEKGHLQAVFPGGEGFRFFESELLPRHELSFAMTVHKSQGSEYDQILLILPPEKTNPLLHKQIIYTALTRARRSAVIYADSAVLDKALATEHKRESGINFWEGV